MMLKKLLARFGIFLCSAEEREELEALHWLLAFPKKTAVGHNAFSLNASFDPARMWIPLHSYGTDPEGIVAQGHGPFLKAYREARGHYEVFLTSKRDKPSIVKDLDAIIDKIIEESDIPF
jgi:hypothetical protein